MREKPIDVIGTTSAGHHIERRLTTDRDGRFEVSVPDGRYRIETDYPNVSAVAVVRGGQTVRVRLSASFI
jgi:hypothetical protein